MYFTPPIYFNDPFEFLPTLERDFTDRELKEFMLTKRGRNKLRPALKAAGIFYGTKQDFKNGSERTSMCYFQP